MRPAGTLSGLLVGSAGTSRIDVGSQLMARHPGYFLHIQAALDRNARPLRDGLNA